jgi:hypothetical protein
VTAVLQAIASGQAQISGNASRPPKVVAAPFIVRVALDDSHTAQRLPAGAAGKAAIFTSHIRPAHIIRRVFLRQIAILISKFELRSRTALRVPVISTVGQGGRATQVNVMSRPDTGPRFL